MVYDGDALPDQFGASPGSKVGVQGVSPGQAAAHDTQVISYARMSSGLNFTRPGLCALLDAVEGGSVQ